jgi:hypothetical protein
MKKMENDDYISVAIHPFFFYAVGPTSGNAPAMPFMTYSKAKEFFEETKKVLWFYSTSLYKRVGFNTIKTIEIYDPPCNSGIELEK